MQQKEHKRFLKPGCPIAENRRHPVISHQTGSVQNSVQNYFNQIHPRTPDIRAGSGLQFLEKIKVSAYNPGMGYFFFNGLWFNTPEDFYRAIVLGFYQVNPALQVSVPAEFLPALKGFL